MTVQVPIEYTTQSAIWHNPRKYQWEWVDERGVVRAWITDEMLFRVDGDMLLRHHSSVIRSIAKQALDAT